MEFSIILPNGENIHIHLKSKELKGNFLVEKTFNALKILNDSQIFGLRYSDKNDAGMNWLQPEENLRTLKYLRSISDTGEVCLHFAVRVSPRNPDLAITTAEGRRLFRQFMKGLLINGDLGCNVKTHAMLDAFIAQAELGNFNVNEKEYSTEMNKFEIFAPTTLSCNETISEINYMKLVRMYHKQLQGTRPSQADILYLSLVQKVPLYGYIIYNICDKATESFFIALSENGVHFVYESYIEKFTLPKKMETFAWRDLVYLEIEKHKVKMGFFPQQGDFAERQFKLKSKYSNGGIFRFEMDLNKYKDLYLNVVDGLEVFDSRKQAQRCYTTKIPQRNKSWNKKFSSFRHSLRNSLRRNKTRHHSNYEGTKFVEHDKRRIHSE